MYISMLDGKKWQNRLLWEFGSDIIMITSIFGAVRHFSYVAKGFGQAINWLEVDSVDFSPVSFYLALNHDRLKKIGENGDIFGFINQSFAMLNNSINANDDAHGRT